MPAEIYILTQSRDEYEDHHTIIIGLTTDKAKADAWVTLGMFNPDSTNEYETRTMETLEDFGDIRKWLDPKLNPMCECGHRLFHHRGGKKRSCKHNSKYQHNMHECKEFRLANPQPTA